MNLEELKAEAAKHGYVLTKKREYIRLKPCVCGSNRRTKWTYTNGEGYEYQCNRCGFCGGIGIGPNDYAARLAWNEAVEKAGDAE